MIRTLVWTIVIAAGMFGCLADDGERTGDAAFASTATDAEIAAQCSQNPKKAAVCHIPPGNPANAHTICISKSAVDTHLTLHGDYLGACEPSAGGQGGAGGVEETGGTPSTSSGETPSAGCDGYATCSGDGDCDLDASCLGGCCIPIPK